MIYKILLFVSTFFFSEIIAYEKELAICAIFQNEASYLKEWIEFHKLQGVEHFYLFNNRSNDQPEKVLDEYVKKGEITLVRWPHIGQVYAQYTCYDHCLKWLLEK